MKNRIEIKQMEEAQLLRYFMMSYPDFPKCKIEKSESPDFILHLNRHYAIGLEMTRLFVQMGKDGVHFMPKFENEKIELIHLIKQRFEGELPYKLSAHFDFSDDYYDVNLDLRLLALEIFDYMKYKLSGYSPNESFFTRIKSKRLPHWLHSIDIMHHPENELSDWVHCKVNVPADNFLTSIQNSIEHKERKIRLYKKRRMDKYWLLIVAECLNCASPFNINNLLERWEFRTSFHEIFLYEMFEQKVYFLNRG